MVMEASSLKNLPEGSLSECSPSSNQEVQAQTNDRRTHLHCILASLLSISFRVLSAFILSAPEPNCG